MVVIKNSLDQFIYEVKENEIIKKMKIYDILLKNINAFYEVCQKFADIALNAHKIQNSKTNDISGIFLEIDIQRAQKVAKEFYVTKNITDVDEYLKAIEMVYDTRCKYGGIKSENEKDIYGEIKYVYCFYKIPNDIWKGLEKETKDYICNKVL